MSDAAATKSRITTGVPGLDQHLGGGLLPGTLTVVVGATGIGKTQLGVQFSAAGREQEGRGGIIYDMTSRGDAQSHADYAERMFGWKLARLDAASKPGLANFYAPDQPQADYLHVFEQSGRRVTRRDLEFEDWKLWKQELVKKLDISIAFFYGNFIRGTRRVVVDGIEPTDRPGESVQFDLFEYVYHQILRKDPEWVARDLFRQSYLSNAAAAATHTYDPAQVACLLLVTSHEPMLDALLERPLTEGDVLATANTLIYMGKTRTETGFGRGLYIAKHRGSSCSEQILPYKITDSGLEMM